jgi:hypothetical protein
VQESGSFAWLPVTSNIRSLPSKQQQATVEQYAQLQQPHNVLQGGVLCVCRPLCLALVNASPAVPEVKWSHVFSCCVAAVSDLQSLHCCRCLVANFAAIEQGIRL